MPCEEISAVVTVVLDKDERLRYYTFEKITCGKIIPLSQTLQAHCKGMTLDALASLRLEELVRAFDVRDEDSFFVLDKELDALQSAVANYRGSDAGLDFERYKIESIEYGDDSIRIQQVILEPKPDAAVPSCRVVFKSR
ncbi:MAG: hypothetical protein ACKVU1_16715 [bacterium]